MQIQATFTFDHEKEYIAFCARFVSPLAMGGLESPGANQAQPATPTKPKTLNQKIAEKAVAAEKPAAVEETGDAAFDAVKESIKNLAKKTDIGGKSGRDIAIGILKKFGYEKVTPEMKEEDYADIVEACTAALEG